MSLSPSILGADGENGYAKLTIGAVNREGAYRRAEIPKAGATVSLLQMKNPDVAHRGSTRRKVKPLIEALYLDP